MTAAEQFIEALRNGTAMAFIVVRKGADANDLGPDVLVYRKQIPASAIPIWRSEQSARKLVKNFDEANLTVLALSFSQLKALVAKFPAEPPIEVIA